MSKNKIYLFVISILFALAGCSGSGGGNSDDTESETGITDTNFDSSDTVKDSDTTVTDLLTVGSPCTKDAQCADPGKPLCITDGLYPLASLASSENEASKGLAMLGVDLPEGYCSTVPTCATDADCGQGGTCFFPLKDVDEATYAGLVSALSLPADDASVLSSFLTYGQCLQSCKKDNDCKREGYECATPLGDFIGLVPGSDMSTFCIGAAATDSDTGSDTGVVDYCSPDPCDHGSCVNGASGYTCTCDTGYNGVNCDNNINDCNPDPCVHGACSDGVDSFTCTCDAGWEGVDCNTNTDDCDPDPCLHGTCSDGLDSYSCSCQAGWTGSDCSIEVFGCDDSPCLHGTCTDTTPGEYSCSCETGYDGINCDNNINDCNPDPCLHGTCSDGIDSYTCSCDTGWDGSDCDVPLTTECILTYNLVKGNGDNGDNYTGVNMRIRDTTASAGDGTWAIGPGTLIIRVPSDGGNNAAAGTAEVLYYENTQQFSVVTNAVGNLTVTTDVTAFSPTLDATGNSAAQATGTIALGTAPTITWDSCTFPSGYNSDKDSYTPDVVGTGPGCLAPYRSVGNVNCNDGALFASCSMGNLNDGDNAQDETWEQKLETLTFSSDLSSFSMPFMQVPNDSPSRTYVSWGGTLDSMVCQ
ncbi:MAG: hypothetical protein JXR91_05885 [Deltaproteobacteria bacterium]|nr:hypothetical protein [Deltaproteobacteria bacterium]